MNIFKKILDVIESAIENVVKKVVPDKDLQNRLTQELKMAIIDSFNRSTDIQKQIIMAEIQGQSWLQRNWRPIAAMIFIFIIANNYILYPYLSLFGVRSAQLDIPPGMWSLLQMMLGGYVIGRSAEKIVKDMKGKI